MRVEWISRQRCARLDAARWRTIAAELMWRACRRGRPRDWAQVTVFLLDDASIAAVNRRVFAKDGPTDVITLAYRPIPGGLAGHTGELFLNVQRALTEGRARPGGPALELALYLAHGCDHLTGGLDDTPAGRAAMRRRERRWLGSLARAGALNGKLLAGLPSRGARARMRAP